MSTTSALSKAFGVVAVLMAGSLAGILIGSGMDQFAAAGLSQAGWLAFRDTNSWVFPTIMPWVFNGTLIVLIVASVLAEAKWPLVLWRGRRALRRRYFRDRED